MCKRDVTWQLLKCLKHLRETTKNLKSLWKIKRFEQQIHCPHHKTTHRNVIHPSLLLLSSLVPFCPLFHAKKYLNYFTINAANKSLWSFWKIRKSFCGIHVMHCRNSWWKNTGMSSFWPPWCHVFLEPQRGSPSSSQYSFLHLSHDTIFVFLPPWKIHPNDLIQHCVVERYRLIVETTQSAFPTSGQCGWETRHQTYLTQWKRRVPAKQSVRVSHGTFMATNLHHDRSIQISLVVVQPLDSNSLPNCLVPRHSYIHNELPKLLTFSPATFLHNQWLQQLTDAMSVSNVAFSNMVCASTWCTHLAATVNDAILLFFGTLTSGLTYSTSMSKTHIPPNYRSHIWKHSMLVHHYPRWAGLTRLRDIASRAPAPPAMPPERHQHPRLDPSTPQEHPHMAATPDQWLAREPVHACTCLCFAR